jgi:hypothetical protein
VSIQPLLVAVVSVGCAEVGGVVVFVLVYSVSASVGFTCYVVFVDRTARFFVYAAMTWGGRLRRQLVLHTRDKAHWGYKKKLLLVLQSIEPHHSSELRKQICKLSEGGEVQLKLSLSLSFFLLSVRHDVHTHFLKYSLFQWMSGNHFRWSLN